MSWNELSIINGTGVGDRSGSSVSLNGTGNILAIGAPLNDVNGTNAGKASVYEFHANDGWQLLGQELYVEDVDGDSTGIQSGISVALDETGHTIIIGAPGAGSGANGTYFMGGSAFIYFYSTSTNEWLLKGNALLGYSGRQYYGTKVSINMSGNIVAVSTEWLNGIVEIFQYSDISNVWVQMGTTLAGARILSTGECFGSSISLSSDGYTIAVGARRHSQSGIGIDTGATYVYTYNAGTGSWELRGNVIKGISSNLQLGTSVSLSNNGTRVAIGQHQASFMLQYDSTTDTWVELASFSYPTSYFSQIITDICVSINGDGTRMLVGLPMNRTDTNDPGRIYIYESDINGVWTIMDGGEILGNIPDEEFGYSVSMSKSGNMVASGAIYNTSFTGSAYTYVIPVTPIIYGYQINSVLYNVSKIIQKNTIDDPFQISLMTSSSADFTYFSNNETVATIDNNGNIQIIGAGTAILTVQQSATNMLLGVSQQISIRVGQYVPQHPTRFTYSNGTYAETGDNIIRSSTYNIPVGETLTAVTFGTDVIEIAVQAFQNQTELNSVIIPFGITTLGADCFRDCTNLSSVTFNNVRNITHIDAYSFYNCSPELTITYLNTRTVPTLFSELIFSDVPDSPSPTPILESKIIKEVTIVSETNEPIPVTVEVDPKTNDIDYLNLNVVNILNTNVESKAVVDDTDDLLLNLNGQSISKVLTFQLTAIKNDVSITDFSSEPILISIELPGITASQPIYVYKLDDITGEIVNHPRYPVQMNYNSAVNRWETLLPTLSTFGAGIALLGDICFPAGMMVETDTGEIPIEQLDTRLHRIRGKHIKAITRTTYAKNTRLIYFEPNSLGKNYPFKDTIMSENHRIFYLGKQIRAKHFVGIVNGVYDIDYNGELLYNVLLENYEYITVNGMKVETLHPRHNIAKMYTLLSYPHITKNQYKWVQEYNRLVLNAQTSTLQPNAHPTHK